MHSQTNAYADASQKNNEEKDDVNGSGLEKKKEKKDPPPVFIMPDGMSYLHVNRNGLIFGCATEKNVSPCAVIEVRLLILWIYIFYRLYCSS